MLSIVYRPSSIVCRLSFTTVESALQIKLFMQNKAKFRKSQMIVNKVLTTDYDKKTLGERGKKQSQTNPNKAKFKKAEMNATSYITKAYENITPIRAPKKQSQTSKRQKPMQLSLPQRIMKKTVLLGPGKTNPNKPNSNPTFRGVASGEAGSNPIQSQNKPNTKPKQTQFQRQKNAAGVKLDFPINYV